MKTNNAQNGYDSPILNAEIEEALSKYPQGLERQKLFLETSAQDNLSFANAIHSLKSDGVIIDMSGTNKGPYILTSNLDNVADSQDPERATVKAANQGKPSARKIMDTYTAPRKSQGPKQDYLDSNSSSGRVAYLLIQMEKAHPGALHSYSRIRTNYDNSFPQPSAPFLTDLPSIIVKLLQGNFIQKVVGLDKKPSVRWLGTKEAFNPLGSSAQRLPR